MVITQQSTEARAADADAVARDDDNDEDEVISTDSILGQLLSFTLIAHSCWHILNSIPASVLHSDSLEMFKSKLKTHFFNLRVF